MSLCAFALVCLVVTTGHAENRAEAERHFRLGEKAYQAQNFRAAADNFEEAYKNYALAEIAFSAAQAYRRLYRLDPKPEYVQRAIDHYREYVNKRKNGGRVADAADALAEMQHELDKLIASGVQVSAALAKEYTRIVINPSLGKEAATGGLAEVREGTGQDLVVLATLDGERADVFAPINVLPGKHKITISADGYFAGTKDAVATQGATTIVDVVLVPRPAKVSIVTESGARISVDGRPAGNAPMAALELSAGRHVITILDRGHEPVSREVVVVRGQELVLREPLQLTRRRKTVPYLLGGAAVATAVFGVSTTFAVLRDGDASDMLAALRTDGGFTAADKARYDRARDARDQWRMAAYLSGGAMAVLGGLAAILYYTDNPSPDGVRVEPLSVQAGAGAAIAGRF